MSEKCDIAGYCPLCKAYTRLTSSEAGKHLLNAKREMLLALTALLEGEIKKTGQGDTTKRARKVRIG